MKLHKEVIHFSALESGWPQCFSKGEEEGVWLGGVGIRPKAWGRGDPMGVGAKGQGVEHRVSWSMEVTFGG